MRHPQPTTKAKKTLKRSRLLIGLFFCCWFAASSSPSSPTAGSRIRTTAEAFLQASHSIVHPVHRARRDYSKTVLSPSWRILRSESNGGRHFRRDDLHTNHPPFVLASFKERNNEAAADEQQQQLLLTRRRALQGLTTAAACLPALPALAGVPEIDSTTGNLFSPKSEMLTGGSAAARGIPLSSRSGRTQLAAGQPIQSIYETRFIAYLGRFLLNFDPSARAYWVQRGFGFSWDDAELNPTVDSAGAENAFAEFAESVEVGLADYFSGPFGSYSSLSAAMAGIGAANPAPSKKTELPRKHGFLDDIFSNGKKKEKKTDNIGNAKQGILNLYTLLKARYNTASAKRQLAILFSFISSPSLQPSQEIRSLLGEADNATVTGISLVVPANDVLSSSTTSPRDYRTSSRRGGGYSLHDIPTVSIEAPPPLGDRYPQAEALPRMKATSRVLKITLVDGGEGYVSAPAVSVLQPNVALIPQRFCQATALVDREGRVESILVLDPGFGYGGGGGRGNGVPPIVRIDPPPRKKGKPGRRARAVAELEYKIDGVQLLKGGNGYLCTEPPAIEITPPREDPDWYLDVQELPSMSAMPQLNAKREPFRAEVTELQFADGNIAYTSATGPKRRTAKINDELLNRLGRDPLEMLPSSTRPDLIRDRATGKMIYIIPQIAAIPQFVAAMSPRYRAYDPIFGGIGRLPVTKGATELEPSEYGRLALSGAVCTVVVRTLLNPLELIKTKQQLQNDDELMAYARSKVSRSSSESPDDPSPVENKPEGGGGSGGGSSQFRTPSRSPVLASNGTAVAIPPTEMETNVVAKVVDPAATKKTSIGTADMIRAIVELRGPLALFQSADITFLASLVFGSFGFGATELFRRSFSSAFLTQDSSDSGSELVLLLAAGVATVLTAAAASPFEVLRVRSMGMLESEKWTTVLQDFLKDKAFDDSERPVVITENGKDEDFDLRSLKPRDLLPLWSGFAPILSRELPFAIAKFLTFDLIAKTVVVFLNAQAGEGALPVQIGVGPVGLTVSAAAGAIAGIAGAFVSHPADLILTKTSASKRKAEDSSVAPATSDDKSPAWVEVVKDLISQDGGVANLFVGLGSRSLFFFLVIGLQFFLYDYVKNLFQVGSDDLSLVLDVFYAVRAGLVEMTQVQ